MTAHQKILQKPDMEGLAARDVRFNDVHFDGIIELSTLMQSYLHSIDEAAWRKEPKVLELHIGQVKRTFMEMIAVFKGIKE